MCSGLGNHLRLICSLGPLAVPLPIHNSAAVWLSPWHLPHQDPGRVKYSLQIITPQPFALINRPLIHLERCIVGRKREKFETKCVQEETLKSIICSYVIPLCWAALIIQQSLIISGGLCNILWQPAALEHSVFIVLLLRFIFRQSVGKGWGFLLFNKANCAFEILSVISLINSVNAISNFNILCVLSLLKVLNLCNEGFRTKLILHMLILMNIWIWVGLLMIWFAKSCSETLCAHSLCYWLFLLPLFVIFGLIAAFIDGNTHNGKGMMEKHDPDSANWARVCHSVLGLLL